MGASRRPRFAARRLQNAVGYRRQLARPGRSPLRRPRMASKEKSGKKNKNDASATLKEKRQAKKAKKAARGL